MKTRTQLAGEDEVLSCVQTNVSGNQFNHVDDLLNILRSLPIAQFFTACAVGCFLKQ